MRGDFWGNRCLNYSAKTNEYSCREILLLNTKPVRGLDILTEKRLIQF